EFKEEISWNPTDEEGDDDDDDDEGDAGKEGNDDDSNAQDDDDQEVEGNDEDDQKKEELYRDVNINLGRGIQMGDVHTTQEFKDSHVTLTPVNPDGQQQSSSVSSQFVTSMLNPTPDAGIESIFETTS
nr:hypothetical protein [Tanacetum cinerariifolium]